jgi:hypothetical protein
VGHISFWLTPDDVNLMGDNIDTIKKNTETLIDASKKIVLEINIEKTKHMLLSRHQNVGRNRDIKIANRSFENVSQFKYMGTTVTNQNLIQEKIKRRLNFGNACYHLVQNLLSSCLLSSNIKKYLKCWSCCSGSRFPGSMNVDINEIHNNMVPFPGLHYISSSVSPILFPISSSNTAPGMPVKWVCYNAQIFCFIQHCFASCKMYMLMREMAV